jgi:Arm DNA-binding domain
MALGKYPDVTLAQARGRLEEARKMLADGIDPMAHRRATRISAQNSYETVAAKWLDHWQVGKSPRHVAYVRRRMEADILPKLGARPITEIDAPELVAMAKILRTAEPVTWPSGPCRPTKFSRGEDGQRDDGDRKFSVSNANDSNDPLPPLPRSSPSDEVPRSPSQAL